MCSEIDRFSSFLRKKIMSDREKTENSVVKSELEGIKEISIELGGSSELRSENPAELAETTVQQNDDEEEKLDDDQKELAEINEKEEGKNEAAVSSRESEKKVAEDDDGFRTPTSSDHRIPPVTECPGAPRKARPPPKNLKRKGSSTPPAARRSLDFDELSEVESFFKSASDEDNAEDRKMKKARRDDEE